MSNLILSESRILKWHFANMENDDRGIWETRGHACEIVAWRFLTHLSEKEAIDYLLHELPGPNGLPAEAPVSHDVVESGYARSSGKDVDHDERSPLLRNQIGLNKRPGLLQFEHHHQAHSPDLTEGDPTVSFIGLNTLEIAAIADAKKFLSQRVVQKIVDDIWSGGRSCLRSPLASLYSYQGSPRSVRSENMLRNPPRPSKTES